MSGAALGGILSGVGSVLGGLGSFSSWFDDNDAYEDQVALMERNNRFQREENEKSRQFQRDMYSQQWQDYQSYNDPSSVAQRLQTAGISPSAAFANMSSGATAASMPSPSSPGHSAAPSPDYSGIANPVNQRATAFASIAQGLQAFANASKTGIESTQIGRKMQAEIQSLLSGADAQEANAELTRRNNELLVKYGDAFQNAQIMEMAQRANLHDIMAGYYIKAGNVQDAEREFKEAQTAHENVLKRLHGAVATQYETDNEFRREFNRAQIGELKSRSAQQIASAEESYANVGKIASEKEALDLANDVRKAGLDDEKFATVAHWISQAQVDDAKRQDALNELIKLRSYGSSLENDTKRKVDAALDRLFGLLGLKVSLSARP